MNIHYKKWRLVRTKDDFGWMYAFVLGPSPVQSNRLSAEQNGKEENVEPISSARFTDCPFCSFTSTDSEAFRKHVLTNHLSDKNFRCLVCNRLYRYRGDCMLIKILKRLISFFQF